MCKFITTGDPSLLLPKPKLPLVKQPGPKLYPLTWLNYVRQDFPFVTTYLCFPQVFHQKHFLYRKGYLVWKGPAWRFLCKGKSHVGSNAMALFKDKYFISLLLFRSNFQDFSNLTRRDAALRLGQQQKINLGYRELFSGLFCRSIEQVPLLLCGCEN